MTRRQQIFGYTEEELRIILAPMAQAGAEPLGAMGTDTPIAPLSDKPRMLFDYFAQRFAQVTDPAYGEVLSPVYRATPSVWAQTRAASTVYETPSGFLASPNAVAERARQYGVVPKAAFANGYQDMDSPSGMRVWWSPTTGAHVVGGGIVEAWTPQLGLATTDEVREGWGVRVTFEHGYITWQPFVGATAYVT